MRSLCLLAALAAVPAASAQNQRPMTFEDMMGMKRLGSTAVSADGKWLGYSVTTVDLDQNTKTPELWLQPVSGGDPVRLAVGQPGDDGLDFAPDGKHVLFLSPRQGGQQVWLADFDPATGRTANAVELTSIATEADNARWSPDSMSVVFTSAVYPDCPAITAADAKTGDGCNRDRDKAAADSKVKARIFTHLLYRHWNHFTGDKRSHLFLVSVANRTVRDLNPGETHDVPPFSTEGGGGFAFAPDSKELAFTEKDVPEEAVSTNADIFTLDLSSPDARPVKVSTAPGGDFNPAYSPDGRYLAWRSQAREGYESDRFRLALYDRSQKTLAYMLPKFDLWIDEFAWGPDSRTIYFVSGANGSSLLSEVGIDGESRNLVGARSEELPSAFEWSAIHPQKDGSVIATGMSVRMPGEVMKLRAAAESGTAGPAAPRLLAAASDQLTHLNDALLAGLDLAPLESFWFAATDGTRVQGFLIRPPGFDARRKYPLKFLIHGGPEGAWGEAWSYRWNAELLAANGYVVVMVNPRGSTGYGQAFVDGVNGDWGGKPYTDLMTGLAYAEEHYPFIDKTRECALGASYGGYMANWILGHSNHFKCIVSHDGMFDPESAYGTTEELWFNEWEFRGKPWDYYGKPDPQNPYRRWAPSLSARNFRTPTLVVHSQLDYRLDVGEGYQLFTTLERLGVPAKMLYFPDEGHWVLKPQNSRLWYRTVNDWVDQWIGPGARH